MAFIVCEIGPRKTVLICRIHFMMEILQLYLFSHMQSSYRWPGLLLQMTDFWVSITFSHVRLLIGLSCVQQCGMGPRGCFYKCTPQPCQVILLNTRNLSPLHPLYGQLVLLSIFFKMTEPPNIATQLHTRCLLVQWKLMIMFLSVIALFKC